MNLFKALGVRLLAVALAFSVVPAAVPSGTPAIGLSKAEAQARFRGGGFHGGRFYRPGGFYRHGGFYGNRGFYGGRGFYGRRGFYGDRGFYGRGRYYGRGYYGRRYYGRHYNDGAAVAAGIIGLGVGAAIANSARPRYYDYGGPRYYRGGSSHARYCAARYRSYDPYTNTFQPYHGPRRICR